MITTCPYCSRAYEEQSEEEANNPKRSCLRCHILALEAKCDLLSASLVKADAQRFELVEAARVAERLLDGVAFVSKAGDTEEPLRLLRNAIKRGES